MKTFGKLGVAAMAVAGVMWAHTASATTIGAERISFQGGNVLLNASNGPASTTVTPLPASDKRVVDGKVQFDLTDIEYWWRTRNGQSSRNARTEQANSWNFTVEHAGKTVDLGGLPGSVKDHWFKTTAFDGIVAGGDWVLTAASNYWKDSKKMIQFDLAGWFNVKTPPTTSSSSGGTSTSSSGGQVPVPATSLLLLAGIAGMAGASRRKKKA